MNEQTRISGQVIYAGPTIPQLGLHFGNIFRDGVFPQMETVIKLCPAFGELFIPVAQYAAVRRELNLDYARQMRGTTGKYVTFYHEVEKWLAERAKTQPPTKGVKLQTHA